MISVQNHRQRSNGNSAFLIVLLIAALFFNACGSSKRTTTRSRTERPRTTTPKKETVRKGKGDVDTLQWTEIDRSGDYRQKMKDLELDKKDVYNVHLLLPFEVEKSGYAYNMDDDSQLGRTLQYYAGTKLALEQLEDEGIDLNVRVYDAESGDFSSKLQEGRKADVIIGPRNREQLINTAHFGKINEIPVISPWLSSTNVTEENPYYIQLIPSVRDHYARIVEHVQEHFPEDQVFLIGRKKNKDMAVMRYIQSLGAANKRSSKDRIFKELYVNEDSLSEGVYAFQEVFFEDKRTVFILPHYSFSEDEDFIYNVVRKLSAEKNLRDVVLYGMPILLDSDKINFEYYHTLNMHIARSSFVNKEDPIVREFRELYFRKYNDFPSEEAFKGFDIMLYIGRNIYNYGKNFQFFLDSYRASLVHTVFDVQRVYRDEDDRFSKIDYFQNKHLYILAFKDYQFRKE